MAVVVAAEGDTVVVEVFPILVVLYSPYIFLVLFVHVLCVCIKRDP